VAQVLYPGSGCPVIDTDGSPGVFLRGDDDKVGMTLPASLSAFLDEVPTSEKTLMLVNRTGAEPLVDLLAKAFTTQDVTIAERQLPGGPDDLVCLIDEGRVVATSPFARLEETFVLINADRYRTGTRPVAPEQFPDVLTGLNQVEFTVAGFPVSNKEKLLLVVMSRFIEHLALSVGGGQLHTSFQRLSRLDDEYGTRTIYGWLADSAVETHLYGVADDPADVTQLDVNVHSDETTEYRRSWVVVFQPAAEAAVAEERPTHAALVAIEVGPNVYRSLWTYDPDRVARIHRYIDEEF
jgi:hypothetical protein